MIYTKLTKEAMDICFEAHKYQLDKGENPYVFHSYHLAEQMDDEYSTCVALLHDVIEDTSWTLKQIANDGFPYEVVEALRLITHDKNEDYLTYCNKLKNNEIARKVKLADLYHNCDLSRLDFVTEEDQKRVKKYQECILLLENYYN